MHGNFVVTDNRAVSAADYDTFSIVAPCDPRLPDGGGYDLRLPHRLGGRVRPTADNFTTLADNYGKQIDHWNGVDVSVNARLRNGIFMQGGTSTGRTSTDNCEILAALPEKSASGAVLPPGHELADAVQGRRLLHRSANRRRDVGNLPVAARSRHRANWAAPNAGHRSSLGHQPGRRRRDADREPGDARHDVQRRADQLDLAVRQDLQDRDRPGRRLTSISTTPRTRTRSCTLNNGFVPSATGGLATWQIPDRDPPAAVLEDRRAVRLLRSLVLGS